MLKETKVTTLAAFFFFFFFFQIIKIMIIKLYVINIFISLISTKVKTIQQEKILKKKF